MHPAQLYIAAYGRLQERLESSPEVQLVPLLSFEYPQASSDLIYAMQEADFTRELVNTFNEFAVWLDRIAVWEQVYSEFTEDEVFYLRHEFTKLPLDFCVSHPYRFRSQLAYCATQLCYTKAIYDNLISRSAVREEDRIDISALSELGHLWPEVPALVSTLRSVDSAAYRVATANYRNKAQHRHPQRLDFGHTSNIVRTFPVGSKVSYAIGESSPLSTAQLIPVLQAEGENMRKSFQAYRSLISAHDSGASGA